MTHRQRTAQAEDSTRQGHLETTCWGLRPTTGHNGCLMMMNDTQLDNTCHTTNWPARFNIIGIGRCLMMWLCCHLAFGHGQKSQTDRTIKVLIASSCWYKINPKTQYKPTASYSAAIRAVAWMEILLNLVGNGYNTSSYTYTCRASDFPFKKSNFRFQKNWNSISIPFHYCQNWIRWAHNTVMPRYNAVVWRHLLGPPYKRGALWDPVDLFDIVVPRQRSGTQPTSQAQGLKLCNH